MFPAMAHAGSRTVVTGTVALHPISDQAGNVLTASSNPSTLLYSANMQNPTLAPDGHQLTLGEWLPATGTASFKCSPADNTTEVSVSLEGLVPNGLYTIWLRGRVKDTSPISFGALPNTQGTNNRFRVNGNGKARLNVKVPSVPLSISGKLRPCLLNNAIVLLIVEYHSDNRTYGPEPGPTEVSLDQVIFRYRKE
jgi:hypothetical protein